MPDLILASASPTRLALLRAAGVPVRPHPVPLDEPALRAEGRAAGLDAAAMALRLAHAKAALVPAAPGALVLAADQMLDLDGAWLEKPTDAAALRAQILRLRGRTHALPTAAVLHRDGAPVWEHVATPRLAVRPFTDAFLDAYLAAEGDALLGCLGGYRLEGRGAQLFSAVEGEHAAVLGLPLLALLAALRGHGVLEG